MKSKIDQVDHNFSFNFLTSESSLQDSINLALFAKPSEQIVSPTSSLEGLMCTTIKTLEPSPVFTKSTETYKLTLHFLVPLMPQIGLEKFPYQENH